jgi:hypothetical protein
MMSSQKQADANRRNAAKSTGPRTPEGKAAARLNALKHGVYANSPVIVGEDLAHYEALSRSHFERFQPAGPEEHTLVAALVRSAWLLERLSRIETELWDRRLDHLAEFESDEAHPLARAAEFLNSSLHNLQRRLDAADRAYRRNLELLLKLQGAPNPFPRQMASFLQNGCRPPNRPALPNRNSPPHLCHHDQNASQ